MDNELASRLLASLSAINGESRVFDVPKIRALEYSGDDALKALHLDGFFDSLRETLGSGKFWAGLSWVAQDYFRQQLSAKVGLQVDEISEAGLAAAIGRRAGFELHSLHDVDIVQADLLRAAADRIAARMGWTLQRVIDTPQALIDEIEDQARGEIEKRVQGLELSDLKNAAATLEQVRRWALGKVRERTGIPLENVSDAASAQAAALKWAEIECRRRIGTGGNNPSGVKMTKKAIQSRLAQRKFYAAHGDRHVMPSVKE